MEYSCCETFSVSPNCAHCSTSVVRHSTAPPRWTASADSTVSPSVSQFITVFSVFPVFLVFLVNPVFIVFKKFFPVFSRFGSFGSLGSFFLEFLFLMFFFVGGFVLEVFLCGGFSFWGGFSLW